jgi:hypothetical protein
VEVEQLPNPARIAWQNGSEVRDGQTGVLKGYTVRLKTLNTYTAYTVEGEALGTGTHLHAMMLLDKPEARAAVRRAEKLAKKRRT